MTVKDNLDKIKAQIPIDVAILAVIKNIPLPKICEAIDAGLAILGENRIQEAEERNQLIREKYPSIKIHFIGHLQTNKIKQALSMFEVIESVDSYHLAEELNKRAQKPLEVFIEVNTSGEASKYGINPEEAMGLIRKVSVLPNLKLTGLMTIGALAENEAKVRECFNKLKQIRDEANSKGYIGVRHLSMGMSHDFSLAIDEGSDIIRLGRALFN